MKAYFKVNENSQEIKVSVAYSLGGYSVFNGEKSPRGYFVYVQAVERGNGMESFTLFEGFKKLLREVKRQSKKVEAEAIAEAKTIMRDLAEKLAREKGWTLAEATPEIK